MSLYQQLQTGVLSLSVLSFSLGAIAPVLAVDAPNSSPSGGAPSRTANGSPQRNEPCLITRGDLNNDGRIQADENLTPMTVLSPANNIIRTLDPHPNLFIYLPQTKADSAELIVYELTPSERGYREQQIYANDNLAVPSSAKAGPRIASYTLEDVALEPGKTYSWTLVLACGVTPAPDGLVEGWITCDEGCVASATIPEPQTLTTNQLAQQATNYAVAEFWNETMRFTAELRDNRQYRYQWQALLESQGLGCFRDVPFADEVGVNYSIDDDPQCFVDQDDDVFVENTAEDSQDLNDLLLQ